MERKAVLKSQINIPTNILHCTADQPRITSTSVGEPIAHLVNLTDIEPPVEVEDLYQLIREPEQLTSLYMSQRCAVENSEWGGMKDNMLMSRKTWNIGHNQGHLT